MVAGSGEARRRATVSAVITTFNEEHNIAACLQSLLWCDELLVVDSYSTDRTVDIVAGFPAVRFLQRPYFGAASQKNWAMDQLAGEWILILDADERCTPEMQREIVELLEKGPDREAYIIRRRVYFLDRVIRFSGWQHDEVVRLVKRGAGRYPDKRVHADMMTRTPPGRLRQSMPHFMIDSFDRYLPRITTYGFWGAAQAWRQGKSSGPLQVLGRPVWRFVRMYIIQLGFLDGMTGLVFCLLQSYATYLKWAILWEWRANARRGRLPALPEFDDDEDTWKWEGASRR